MNTRLKKAVGKVIVLSVLSATLSGIFATPAFAKESGNRTDAGAYTGSIRVCNAETGEVSEIPMNQKELKVVSSVKGEEGAVTETHEAIIEIDKNGNASYVESVPPMTRSDASSSDSNTYWKASITITYSVNSSTASLTKVSGYWTQLRGNTTLSNRRVYYAIDAGISGYSDTKYPTSNSFSYNTGFASLSSSRLYSIGANSSATVTTEAGLQLQLVTNVEKKYTS